VAGYGVAALTAADRVRRDRHHWYDVCAGAAIGLLSTEATYWLCGKLFPDKQQTVQIGLQPTGVSVQVAL
jgi:membrane-associated phospholipid phosphatase